MRALVIQTGLANVASVLAALRRVGVSPALTDDPAAVRAAERVVLPGVGAFGPAMARLEQSGLAQAIVDRVQADKPLLGICLGMQLLCRASEESPGRPGLGLIPTDVQRFGSGLPTPQLGWNRIEAAAGPGVVTSGDTYFANSFRVTEAPAGWRATWSVYGQPFVASLERGRVVACQFHPELSGAWGLALLRRWALGETGASEGEGQPGLKVRLIPCLDVRDGRVVKGVRFQGLRDAGDPAERAEAYAMQGADELVLLDVSATQEGRSAARETVRRVRERVALPLTVGGGIRTIADAEALLEAGADKVSLNSAAVQDPQLLTRIATRFGRQCTVVAIDARGRGDSWETVIRSGTEATGLDAVRWATDAVAAGAGEVLLTSMDRDGTQSGYDLDLLRAVSAAVDVPVIASGGARTEDDLATAVRAGASAVLAASVLHDGLSTVTALKDGMARAGVEVRR